MAGFISHILLEEFVSLPDSFTLFFFFLLYIMPDRLVSGPVFIWS